VEGLSSIELAGKDGWDCRLTVPDWSVERFSCSAGGASIMSCMYAPLPGARATQRPARRRHGKTMSPPPTTDAAPTSR